METIKNLISTISFEDVKAYLLSSISILAVLLTLFFITYFVLKRIEKKEKFDVINSLRNKLRWPVILLIIYIGIYSPFSLLGFEDEQVESIKIIFSILLIIIISWISIRGISALRDLILSQYDISQKDNLKARKVFTQYRLLERILVFVIVIIAIALILMSFESIRKIGVSLIASAGIAGIILGFAAQKLIGTVLAGFQLAITQPIRIEDALVVEGEWGWVEEINLTYVVIKIWDKRRLILPTTYFIEKPFQNWTRTTAEILGTVFLYTDYSVSFDAIRNELTKILENTDLWDKQVNVVQVTDATEKTVEIRVLVSAQDSPTAWDLRVLVREKLIEFLQKNYPEALPRSRVELMKE